MVFRMTFVTELKPDFKPEFKVITKVNVGTSDILLEICEWGITSFKDPAIHTKVHKLLYNFNVKISSQIDFSQVLLTEVLYED